MSENASQWLAAVDDIEKVLHQRAERRGTPDEEEVYTRLRAQLMADDEVRQRLPAFILKSRNLQAIWTYLGKFPTWKERREFASNGLERVRAWLEGREGVGDDDDGSRWPDSRTFLHTLRQLLQAEGFGNAGALTLGAMSSFGVTRGEGTLYLRVPVERIKDVRGYEQELIEAANRVLPRGLGWRIRHLSVDPLLEAPPDEDEPLPGPTWKPARAMQHDGLWFRSKTEIRVYEALRKRSVFFFVNAAGVLGGKLSTTGRAALREPDFVVCLDGKWGILEVMGEHVHTSQTAPKDHDRARLFKEYGVMMIEFFDAHRCYTDPESVVDEFLGLLAKT
jgi:hypothetical protein